MDNLNVKEWLERGRVLRMEIDALKLAREEALARAVSITSRITEAQSGNRAYSRGDGSLVEYADGMFTENLSERIMRLEGVLFDISGAIYAVEDGILRLLLINRYILFKTWEHIADDMNYSYSNVTQRLYPKALRAVGKYLEKAAS